MAQILVTSFLLFVLYWAEITGEEICYSSDMKDMMAQLRIYQTKTRDMITAMKEKLAVMQVNTKALEEKNSVLENKLKTEIKESQNASSHQNEKILDLENNVHSLTERNQQQDKKIDGVQEMIEVLDDKTSVSENDFRNVTQESREATAYQQQKNQDLENNVDTVIQRNRQQDSDIETMQEQIENMAVNNSFFSEAIKDLTQESQEKITDLTEKHRHLETIVSNLTDTTDKQLTIMQEQMTGFEDGVAEIKDKNLELESSLENLTQVVQQQETQIERLTSGNLVEKIAFVARKLLNTTLSAEQTFVFTSVDLDTKNAYDNTTGKFTAPVAGTYLFSVQICTYGHSRFYTIKSSKTINNVHAAMHYYYYGCKSVTTIISLEKSEYVWVETGSTNYTYYMWERSVAWNMFAGTLLVS